MKTPQVTSGYRYYLPTFVGASAGITPKRRRRVVCTECTEIYGEQYSTEDGCPRYDGTSDSNGALYCRNCGHGEWVHP